MSPACRRLCRKDAGSLNEDPLRGFASSDGRGRSLPPKARWRERPRVSLGRWISLRRISSRLRGALSIHNEIPGPQDVLWRRQNPGFDTCRSEGSGRVVPLGRTSAHLCSGSVWGTSLCCLPGQPLLQGVARAPPPLLTVRVGRDAVLRLNVMRKDRAPRTLTRWILLIELLVLSCRRARTPLGNASKLVVTFRDGELVKFSIEHSRLLLLQGPLSEEQSTNQRICNLMRHKESVAAEVLAGDAASHNSETKPKREGRPSHAERRRPTSRRISRRDPPRGPQESEIRPASERPSRARLYARSRAHGLGQTCGWAEWCVRTVVVLAVWASVVKSHAQQDVDVCQQKYNRTADQICDSMDLRNNISALEKLCHCRIIDGHLHFVLQEQRDNASITRLSQYSFPGLREITHHLLVYRVFNLTSLRQLFPNLAVIRGDVLFHNYALVIYDVPNLQEVGLASLTVILRGSVRIERNPQLCYVHTVDWEHITVNRLAENYINRNRPQRECSECPQPKQWFPLQPMWLASMLGTYTLPDMLCWKPVLSRGVPRGCQRPHSATSCHACRNLLDEGRCTHSCSSPKFKVLQHRCEERSFCRKNYVIKLDTKECVKRCPLGYNLSSNSRGENICIPCKGSVCPKECADTIVKSISRAQSLRGCTIITGNLTININGGENIERELEENLNSIEEVKGYVKIFRSNVTSLDFLKNLTKIGGKTLLHS
ncbi:uncharacterized protein LOC122263862, partial [Penaeus japonicus]|uniref:uncharacterized protein LOC122263862 n=1 Tax=Penaeus japonicus TaxID=27405 RepID=UPI001C70DE28